MSKKLMLFISFLFFPFSYFLISKYYKKVKKYYFFNVGLFVFLQILMATCSVDSYGESFFKVQMLFNVP